VEIVIAVDLNVRDAMDVLVTLLDITYQIFVPLEANQLAPILIGLKLVILPMNVAYRDLIMEVTLDTKIMVEHLVRWNGGLV
jgi:hypothetical protein